MIKLIYGDCLSLMGDIPDQSVDMILCDLPYGTTQNKWDSVIPFEPLWVHYKRICKGAIALTASQPFTSALVMSNISWFRHEWVWIKNAGSNFANTVREPFKWLAKLADHNDGIALVFARTETIGFFEQVWERADAVFFFKGRLKFWYVDGTEADTANAPSCLIAYGQSNVEKLRNCSFPGKLVVLKC